MDRNLTSGPENQGPGETVGPVSQYVERYNALVELEREEEMREHEESIRRLSGEEREARGRAILSLRGRDEGEALEGRLVTFMRRKRGEPLPDTEIAPGDLVMISRDDPLRDDNPTGTLVRKTNYSLTAAFDHAPDFVFGKGLRMDLYVNDITYRRMKRALLEIEKAEGRLAELRDIIIGEREPADAEAAEIAEWYSPDLNDSQKKAVARSLVSEDIHLIHGPPGTGKTTTAIEVIRQAVARGGKVLATAASNVAVDNLLEFLLERDIRAVRVGHPARVTPLLRKQTLDSLVLDNEKYRRSEELRETAFSRKERQEEYTYPSGRWRRGMSDEKIRTLAWKGRSSRGVPEEKIREMAEWLKLQNEVDELFEEADKLRGEAVAEILDAREVVCTTNSTAGSDLLAGREFDLVVIDEATQATEPSCLIPLTRGRKVIMAGDHRQLPPTVKNREAADRGLDHTLFERLADRHGEIRSLLNVQYRMNERIMNFSSETFYEGALRAHKSVASHTLEGLGLETCKWEGKSGEILEAGEPVVFVDTSGMDAAERSREGSSSRENPAESRLVAGLVEDLLASGMREEDIAVISPYNDQVDLLQRSIGVDNLEVKSVDGFQGREKEAVIISLTRSNREGKIGFLKDVRRLNVALTRARRKLVVIGDRSTISAHPVYERFAQYAEEQGRIVEY